MNTRTDYHLAQQAIDIGAGLNTALLLTACGHPGPPPSGQAILQTGWLAGEERQVGVRRAGQGYEITVAGVGRFRVADDGASIQQDGLETDDPDQIAATLLGPPLILALALRGVFCLHAGAALVNGRLLAFLGESGRGKSTLAAFLDTQPGARRVSDDVLPVQVDAHGVWALPHFPQLKLPPDRQPALGLPQRLPLTAVYLLNTPAPAVRVDPLAPAAAALALVRHTVAARLFDKDLLARHLTFAAQAAARAPVKRLAYPHSPEALPQVAAAL